MAITAADLKFFQSVNMVDDDTSTVGGAIVASEVGRVKQHVLAAANTLEILSDNAGDTTQTVTVEGRNSAGGIISDTKTLNGTTPVLLTGTFERVLSTTKSAGTTGTVTLRISSAGATVVTLAPTETSNVDLFRKSASESSIEIRYEKIFAKNDHATLTLNSATVAMTADPDTRLRWGEEDSADDTASNRLTEPGGPPSWQDGTTEVSVGSVAAQADVGLWIEQNLPASDSPHRSTFTMQLKGDSA